MAKPRRTWRTKIDDLIESEITKAGFEPFDGIAYSFPISDEVLGIAQIYNQTSIYGKKALINTNFGIIHYQLGVLMTQMQVYPRSYCQTTLSSRVSDFDIWCQQFELHETTPEEEKHKEICRTVADLQNRVVPYLRENFKDLASITKHLKSRRNPNNDLLCLALVANKETVLALEIAWQKLCRYDEWSDKIVPTPFKYKFDEWLKAGAKLPDLKKAKELTFEDANKRKAEVAELPRSKRPTS